MPKFTTPLTKRLVRWMLAHEQPAPLALEHPAQIDMAEAADEIEYLRDGLQQIADAAKDGAHSAWIASTARARLRGEEFIELPTV